METAYLWYDVSEQLPLEIDKIFDCFYVVQHCEVEHREFILGEKRRKMKNTVKVLSLVLAFILLITLAACVRVTSNNSGSASLSEAAADILNDGKDETPDNNGGLPPSEYSKYIGIWRGYAVAVFETLVVTDILEDKMVFLFVNVMQADGAPDSTSPVYTMPIIDNQIQLVDERLTVSGALRTTTTVLTFYDDYISLLRIVDDKDFGEKYEFEWRLRRLS